MKYYRLRKDTPEAPAGTIFEEKSTSYHAIGYNCMMGWSVVEEQPEWFEEVEMIFVRPHNADRLQEIDRMANEGDFVIAQPTEVGVYPL